MPVSDLSHSTIKHLTNQLLISVITFVSLLLLHLFIFICSWNMPLILRFMSDHIIFQ